MKTTGDLKVSDAKTTISEAKTRESLHDLQPAAMDKENLVGGGRKLKIDSSLKDALKKDIKNTTDKPKVTKPKRKKVICKNKATQTAREEKKKIEIEDLTSETPSEYYWEKLAEKRRIALDDTLEENQMLHESIAKLKEEVRLCHEMLDETRALVEVLQDMIGDDRNDIQNSLEDSAL